VCLTTSRASSGDSLFNEASHEGYSLQSGNSIWVMVVLEVEGDRLWRPAPAAVEQAKSYLGA
jgi:hypothetical protein